jgi:recombinational DNA repair ATPase RecF
MRRIFPLVKVLLSNNAQGQAMIMTAVTLFQILEGSEKAQNKAVIAAIAKTIQVK